MNSAIPTLIVSVTEFLHSVMCYALFLLVFNHGDFSMSVVNFVVPLCSLKHIPQSTIMARFYYYIFRSMLSSQ